MPRGSAMSGASARPKGLNVGAGSDPAKNRYKFQKMTHRVKRARTEARAGPRALSQWDDDQPTMVNPDLQRAGVSGTFFNDALSTWSQRELTGHFKRFARAVYIKVQTLPLLLHHLPTVVTILLDHLAPELDRLYLCCIATEPLHDAAVDIL